MVITNFSHCHFITEDTRVQHYSKGKLAMYRFEQGSRFDAFGKITAVRVYRLTDVIKQGMKFVCLLLSELSEPGKKRKCNNKHEHF